MIVWSSSPQFWGIGLAQSPEGSPFGGPADGSPSLNYASLVSDPPPS